MTSTESPARCGLCGDEIQLDQVLGRQVDQLEDGSFRHSVCRFRLQVLAPGLLRGTGATNVNEIRSVLGLPELVARVDQVEDHSS